MRVIYESLKTMTSFEYLHMKYYIFAKYEISVKYKITHAQAERLRLMAARNMNTSTL